MQSGAADALAVVHEYILVCTDCPLHLKRIQAVPGSGPAGARIMAVGEGPGETEDRVGRPFVGAAGNVLTKLLESIGLRRDGLNACGVDHGVGHVARQRSDHFDAGNRQQLRFGIDGDVGLAIDQKASREAARRRMLGLAFHLLGNSQLGDLLGGIDAAGAAGGRIGVADRFRRQQRLLERVGRGDVRLRRAGFHADRENRFRKYHVGAGHDLAGGFKGLDIALDQNQRVGLFAGLRALGEQGSGAPGDGELVAGCLLEFRHQIFQHALDADSAEDLDFGGGCEGGLRDYKDCDSRKAADYPAHDVSPRCYCGYYMPKLGYIQSGSVRR